MRLREEFKKKVRKITFCIKNNRKEIKSGEEYDEEEEHSQNREKVRKELVAKESSVYNAKPSPSMVKNFKCRRWQRTSGAENLCS